MRFVLGVIPHSTPARAYSGGHVVHFEFPDVVPQFPGCYFQILVDLGSHYRYRSRRSVI